MKYSAIFYHHRQYHPITIMTESRESFVRLCNEFPTNWAYLIDNENGEIVDEYKNSCDNNVNKNIE